MDPDLHPMNASAVASHDLPKIKGCCSRFDLVCKIRNSIGYHQESIVITMTSIVPSGLTWDLSSSSNTIGVCLSLCNPKVMKGYFIITFMDAPKSINVLVIGFPSM